MSLFKIPQDKLRVWALAFTVVVLSLGCLVLALLGKEIPAIVGDILKIGMGGLLMVSRSKGS